MSDSDDDTSHRVIDEEDHDGDLNEPNDEEDDEGNRIDCEEDPTAMYEQANMAADAHAMSAAVNQEDNAQQTIIVSGAKLQGLGRARVGDERITNRLMTKFERARILGTRAQQISMNAPVLSTMEGEVDPLEIAQKELRDRKIPIIIRRILPDNSYEDWKVEELEVDFDRIPDSRYAN
eukprot:Tbor_TRINITY_DN10022_c0_g1::TRINITY_DN10022_c0_g1_i1::g.12300::m.12300/K03014/RPB6, POLR2F; DNA-directed RNA polymerases I, II, and III subunit RPABC2